MRQQCVFVAQKDKHVLGSIKRSAASRMREVIIPILCNQPMSSSNSHLKKDMDLLEQIMRRAMSMIRELEYLSYEDRVRKLGLLRTIYSGWEKAPGRPYSRFLVPKGGL